MRESFSERILGGGVRDEDPWILLYEDGTHHLTKHKLDREMVGK